MSLVSLFHYAPPLGAPYWYFENKPVASHTGRVNCRLFLDFCAVCQTVLSVRKCSRPGIRSPALSSSVRTCAGVPHPLQRAGHLFWKSCAADSPLSAA